MADRAERVIWALAIVVLAALVATKPPRSRSDTNPSPPTCATVVYRDAREGIPWRANEPRDAKGDPPTVWTVLLAADQFVGRPTDLTGFLVRQDERAWLAQSAEEVRAFDRQRAERPASLPPRYLLSLEGVSRLESGLPNDGSSPRVRVRGTVRAPPDPSEPEPDVRWAHGVRFDVFSLDPL